MDQRGGNKKRVSVRKTFRPANETLESRLLLSGETAYISEFMASNSNTLLDRYREFSDWIEIYNPDDQVLSLEGWFLTDDADLINKWELPDIEIDPNSAVVVFASGNDRSTSREAHTNFRLSSDGEYLALVRPDLSIAHAYSPSYPAQFTDVSYGISFVDGQLQPGQQRFFPHATPGEANNAGVTQLPPTVEIQANSGYFDAPLSVTLASDRTGATIRYTVDGNIPDDSSPIYQGPVTIDTTTVLRAVAFSDDAIPSEIATKTFIYLDDVLTQTGEGLPEEWGYFDDQGPARPARAQANYAMDPDVVNDPDYSSRIKDDLRAVPTISLVVDPDDLWDFENGIYSNPEQKGDQWERLVSAEWMDESGVSQFNINAGIRIHGGWARRFTFNSKFSFRLHFRGQYGTDSLDFPLLGDAGQSEWQSLILRGGFNDSWQGGSATNTYLQDHWTAATQIEMGGHAPERRYAHLYLNGLYWGMYAVTERMDANWAATHQGGSPDEWDVVNTGGNLIDGEPRPWSDFTRLFGRGDVDYAAVKELLDVEAYADYMIVNQYVGNWDWPHNNWYASRRRVDGAKWHFHTWDAEAAFQNGIGENRVSNVQSAVGPAQVWLALIEVPEFRDMFAGRVYKHLFNDGLLTPDVNSDRLDRLAAGMDQAIVGESARWGDGRVDQTRTPLTREHWVRRIEAIKRSYFGNRTDRLLQQYRDAGLFPEVMPPSFSEPSGRLATNTPVQLNVERGDIYYTLDGTDPLNSDGTLSDSAIRLNTFDLVTADSAARWFVPQSSLPTDWTTNEFDATSWNEGFASVGFETGEFDDLLSVPNGFRVREVESTSRLDSIADADALLAGTNVQNETIVENVPYINYQGSGRDADFENDNLDFPNGGNDFALDITGQLVVKQSGTYSIGLTRNDAARLSINGQIIHEDTQRYSASATDVFTVELDAGMHDVHLMMFNRTGTSLVELSYAVGEKSEVDASFNLIGDAQHRSYAGQFQTDVGTSAIGANASVLMRIPFQVSSIDELSRIALRTQYDDGFVAYLNGQEVARRNAPETLAFDSSATSSRGDVDVLNAESIDLSEHLSLLRTGDNVLSIHALNLTADDADLLNNTTLVAGIAEASVIIDRSANVRARVVVDGIWSPVADATYQTSALATLDALRISEIHYHPAAPTFDELAAGFDDADMFEFIELQNVSDQPLSLAGAQFISTLVDGSREGIEFAFDQFAEIPAGGYAVIVKDVDAFRYRYGTSRFAAGYWDGQLGNGGETITLQTADLGAISVTYNDDWYPLTDGVGGSLEVRQPQTQGWAAWNRAATWSSGAYHGTPGRGPQALPGDANQDGVFDSSDLMLVFQANEYEDDIAGNSTWEEGDWNGDGEFNSQDIVWAFMNATTVISARPHILARSVSF